MDKEYIMIRCGDFGNSGRKKLIYSGLGCLLSTLHPSYFCLFITATISWTFIEYLLVLFKMREISLLRINGLTLNTFVSAILRGGQECGFVTIFCFVVGDLLAGASVLLWVVTILLWFYLFFKISDGVLVDKTIQSIRVIFTPLSVGIMTIIFVMNLYFLSLASNTELYRIGRFMFVMFSVSSFWTLGQVRSGRRRVMLGQRVQRRWCCSYCSLGETLIVFTYDIVIEICSAYLIFYFLVKTCTYAFGRTIGGVDEISH